MLHISNIAIRGGRGKERQLVDCDDFPLMRKLEHTGKRGGYNMHNMGPTLLE